MFEKKAKKERKAKIERHKKMFKIQLAEFRRRALSEEKKLREVYWEHHFHMTGRETTNIITADRAGRGEKTRGIEIEAIHQMEDEAEQIFREALDEFIADVGEVEHVDPGGKTEVRMGRALQAEAINAMEDAGITEPATDDGGDDDGSSGDDEDAG